MSFFENPDSEVSYGFSLLKLNVDEAYVRVESQRNEDVYFYQLNSDCNGCPYEQHGVVSEGQQLNFSLSTKYSWSFLISSANRRFISALSEKKLGEFGVYEVNITDDGETPCRFITLKEPVFEYGVLVLTLVVALLLLLSSRLVQFTFRLLKKKYNEFCLKVTSSNEDTGKNESLKQRLKSLDAFRGICIVVMIFVNHGGGAYWFFGHATWDGLLVADLVFPWFVWIMGVCTPMGISSQLKKDVPKSKIFFVILKRSVKLFIIGIVLNSVGGFYDLSKYRVPGVLQRFAVSYLVTASVYLFCSSICCCSKNDGKIGLLGDVIQLLPQWIFHLAILAIYLVIVFVLPVEGCPKGYLGPSGISLLQDELPSSECIGGITGAIDKWVMKNHIYQNPTAKAIYKSGAFDPEGILGCLPTIFQTFLGVQAYQIIICFKGHKERIVRWIIWAVLCGIIGAVFCSASQTGGIIPVNKNLWSVSFVMATTCLAFLLLALLYSVVDVLKWWNSSPFFQCGMNSIFMYVGHTVTYAMFPWHFRIGLMNTHWSLFLENLWGTILWVLIALYLHKKKLFYTV